MPKRRLKTSERKRKKRTRNQQEGTCFVISPFGGLNDRYYDDVYKPAVKAAGFEPRRADDIYRPGVIMNDIWALIESSKVMLADLTGKNPNVFYELGLAHAVKRPVILVTQKLEDVPFDLRNLRIIQFTVEDPRWPQELKEKITNSLKEILQSPDKSVPTFVKQRKSKTLPRVSSDKQKLIALERQLNLLGERLRSKGSVGELSPEETAALDFLRSGEKGPNVYY